MKMLHLIKVIIDWFINAIRGGVMKIDLAKVREAVLSWHSTLGVNSEDISILIKLAKLLLAGKLVKPATQEEIEKIIKDNLGITYDYNELTAGGNNLYTARIIGMNKLASALIGKAGKK